ncbi:MAG: response regulator transcription factor [Pseudomonadota bacterium]
MKILIADDHDLVRDTLAAFLSREKDFDVDTAADLNDALDKIYQRQRYHLVLLDYSMPGMDGLIGLAKSKEANEPWPVAIMSGIAPKAIAQEALDAGAIGLLPKTMAANSMINAIRFMSAGESYVPVQFMTAEDPEETNELAKGLSPRELGVLSGLCRGLANKEIARELELQEVTIKLHVKTLCRKLDAKNRTQAAMIAKEAGLF